MVEQSQRDTAEHQNAATWGSLAKVKGPDKRTAWRILKEDLDLKPVRELAVHRVKTQHKKRWLELCNEWRAETGQTRRCSSSELAPAATGTW